MATDFLIMLLYSLTDLGRSLTPGVKINPEIFLVYPPKEFICT